MPKKPINTANKRAVQDMTELDQAIQDLRVMRDKHKALGLDISEQQEALLTLMEQKGIDSRRVKVGDKYLTAKRRQNTSIVIDEKRLKKRLGAALWNKVTTRALDKKKLEAFVASGEVKPAILAECSEEKTTKPFIDVR